MATNSLHIIQKQLLDITVPDIGMALNWEANGHQAFLKMIQDPMERCFNDIGRSDEYLIIDKLDIDLGTINFENLQQELPEKFYLTLRKMLEKYRQAAATDSGPINPDDDIQRNDDRNHLFSGSDARLKSLFFFLQNGYLPWWASEFADWDEEWLHKLPPGAFNNIQNFLNTNGEQPVARLVNQFSDVFIATLLYHLGVKIPTIEAWQWLNQVLDVASGKEPKTAATYTPALDLPLGSRPVIRKRFWQEWIAYSLGHKTLPTLHDLLSGMPEISRIIHDLAKHSPQNDELFSCKAIPVMWKKELEQRGEFKKDERDLRGSRQTVIESKKPGIDSKLDPVANKENNVRKRPSAEKLDERLLVNNAGLVLLHPFLRQLFRENQWVIKGQFLDSIAQTKAIYALNYLATGKSISPEHQLLLPKFLVGMAWDNPLDAVEPITESDKIAYDDLLAQVIAHWKTLGNTSPDGLREAFLMRDGKLEPDVNGWLLSVEHKTQDILLGRLPWGISLIKFPWMPQMVTVAWQQPNQ